MNEQFLKENLLGLGADLVGFSRLEKSPIKNQENLTYAITVAAISFVCYIIAAFVQNAIISLAIAIALTVGTLFVIKAITKKKA